ncbi:MAG: hypothetical protein AB1567_03720 [bacterium]
MTEFPTKIIMDTGPLLDFLLASCFKTFPIKHLQYIKNERQYKNLRDYIFSTESILLTPYVIAEMNYHVRKIKNKEIISKFWRLALEFLSDDKFQEEIIKIIEINLQELLEWGITDASLIILGEKTNLSILTGDSSLWGYYRAKGRSSVFINEITEYKIR